MDNKTGNKNKIQLPTTRILREFETQPPNPQSACVLAYVAGADEENITKEILHRKGTAALVRYSPNKHGVTVTVSKKEPHADRLGELTILVRAAEQSLNHSQRELKGVLELQREGDAKGRSRWSYQKGDQTLATKNTFLDLDTLLDLIGRAMDPKGYHPQMEGTCKMGLCVSSDNSCPWFTFQLSRCVSNLRVGRRTNENKAKNKLHPER